MEQYKIIKSPIGNIKLIEDNGFLREIKFTMEDVKLTSSIILDECERQLLSYFNGELKVFNIESLNLKMEGTNFQKEVWTALTKIPYGQTISYKELSYMINHKNAFRACGTANGKNKFPIIIPCHRVINANGSLGGYSGGIDIKIKLLELEAEHIIS